MRKKNLFWLLEAYWCFLSSPCYDIFTSWRKNAPINPNCHKRYVWFHAPVCSAGTTVGYSMCELPLLLVPATVLVLFSSGFNCFIKLKNPPLKLFLLNISRVCIYIIYVPFPGYTKVPRIVLFFFVGFYFTNVNVSSVLFQHKSVLFLNLYTRIFHAS